MCGDIGFNSGHIHYSLDVLFAFPFTYICYRSAKYMVCK